MDRAQTSNAGRHKSPACAAPGMRRAWLGDNRDAMKAETHGNPPSSPTLAGHRRDLELVLRSRAFGTSSLLALDGVGFTVWQFNRAKQFNR